MAPSVMLRGCRVLALHLGVFVLGSYVAIGSGRAGEPEGYWLGDAEAPVPATIHGGTVIRARELEALLRRGGAVLVDVSNAPRRPGGLAPGDPWMPLPHRALPGALWIPGAGAGDPTPEMDGFYRGRLTGATAGNLDAPLVVYCHDRCWLSWNAAKRAVGYGYRHVYWFSEGIEGWTAGSRPTALVEPQVPPAAPQSPTDSKLPKLIVLDIELTGDLGGPEFAAEHEARLKAESARLRQDLERTGLYRILDTAGAQATIDRLRSQQAYLHDCNGCDLEIGRELGSDLVLVAWVDRVSGLILTLTYEIHDVKSGQITARKSFDFRGDNDNAWNHAIDYMVRDLKSMSGASAGHQ
ncbi:MAG: rhodanese [Gammaproteobacteria bacterium]|nr:rhodanese [Gammaproteobacteria bacterium]